MKTLGILLALSSFSVMASDLKCHTPNLEHQFTIKDKVVVLHQRSNGFGFDSKRKISSIDKVKSVRTPKGVKKWLKHNGKQYKIEIADISNPSAINDYVTISMGEKYKVSYPLDCK